MPSYLSIARQERNSVACRGWLPMVALLLLASTLACPVAEAQSDGGDSALIALGQRIYRQGILPSGQPLRGLARPGLIRAGSDAACIACHRRSGFGMTEGNVSIRPITSAALFQSQPITPANPRIAHQLGVPLRLPYDDRTLARAIREGVDISGRPLGDNMPRYVISDEEMKPLLAYLKTLSSQPEPAVSEAEIHLATVIQPGVEPQKRRDMLDVLAAFLKDKNAGTRWDEHRRQAGIMRMQRAYRKWNIHVWELSGPPEAWGAQMEAYYRQQPVFALIGGLGGADWTPIQDFSERFELPCIFPQAELPARGGEHFYTLYLSRGILLEADVLARYLAERPEPEKLIQVFRRNTPGETAAREFRSALPGAEKRLDDRVLDEPDDGAFWQRLGDEKGKSALILWLDPADLDRAAGLLARLGTAPTVYLSSTLLGGVARAAPLAAAGASTLLVYPWDSPGARDTALTRTRAWLQHKGIAASDDRAATDTFFAVSMVGDVLSHILDSFSREYFIERIEHAVQQTLVPSSFPHVSLGPNQRFAAKGSYIVRLDADKGFTAVSGWIVP